MPKVSVVIPCYNCAQYIAECLDSVLEQTFKDYEIVVVNDGSTDDSLKVIQEYAGKYSQIKVIDQENQGLVSRNNGIKEAQGEYILPLDADDKIAPTYLEKAIQKLEDGYDIVYCQAEYFGCKKGYWDLPEYSLKRMLNYNLIFCSAFYKKSDWEKVGGYKKEMVYGWEDYEFWISLIEQGAKIYRIPEILFFYRQKEQNSAIQSLIARNDRLTQMRINIMQIHKDFYEKHKGLLDINNRLIFYREIKKKMPFFYKEKTPDCKIYHFGSWSFSVGRKKNI